MGIVLPHSSRSLFKSQRQLVQNLQVVAMSPDFKGVMVITE
jgi:hypothetical protein